MNTNFRAVIELLYANKIVDSIKYYDLYQELRDVEFRDDVNQHLEVVGRKCVETPSGKGYFMIFKDPSEKECQRYFKENLIAMRDKLIPFVSWLIWTGVIANGGLILTTEQKLKKDEIYKILETNTQFCAALSNLVDEFGIVKKSNQADDHLNSIFDWFEKNDYLIKRDASGLVYIATDKWSVLEEYLMFFARVNNVPRAKEIVQETLL